MIWCVLSLISVILFFYYHNYVFVVINLVMIVFSYIRNKKSIFIISQVIIALFCLFRFNYFNIDKLTKVDEFVVIEKYENYLILQSNDIKVLYYDKELNKGNKVKIKGNIELLSEDNDFYSYLKKNKINYLLKGKVISNNNYLAYNETIINKLLEDKDDSNASILRLILFNQKNSNNAQYYKYFELFSINFLLVVSGYHINLILKLLNKTKIVKHGVILFYLYLLNFSVSSFKSYLYYIVKKVSKKFNLILNNSDILSLIMIAFLFLSPSYCFNKGFIYSFMFSFILDLINNVITNKSFKYMLLKKILIYCCSIPIVLLNNYSINSNSLLANLLLVYPISFFFIFSFIYLFLDKFYLVYKLYVYFLKLLLEFLSTYSFEFVFGKPSLVVIVLMYGMLLLFLYCYQNRLYKLSLLYFVLFLGVNIFQYNLPNLDNRELVYFLDIEQGDCSILKIKNSKKVVMIDTGGNKYKDLANNTIIPFLKSKGINEIDKIIISHDDFDHNGAKEELIKNFKVNEVNEDSLIDNIKIGDKKFINLNKTSDRDNDGSMVLYGEYGGINYLFSGDISSKVEEKIIASNKDLKVDVLKVSHHGSSTSTSYEFLTHINPKVALIGVGSNNLYKHPSSEVIDRLNKLFIKIYRTDIDGSILIYKSLISERIIIIN